MDYELLSYAFVAMSLGLMLGTLIGKRKIVLLLQKYVWVL